MDRFEAPRVDVVVLVMLLLVTGIAASFGATMYWAMQPTVIANSQFTELKQKRSFLHELTASPVPDMEQAAFDVATEENAELGFPPPVALASTEALTAMASAQPKQEDAAPRPKPAKQKRVAQVQKRAPPAPAPQRQAWGLFGFFQFQ
jgi:hypothetical protein